MKTFDYETITLQNIDDNPHLNFVCDGDSRVVKIESEEQSENI